MATTLYRKNVSKTLRADKISPYKARLVKNAFEKIENVPVDVLCKSGKVQKLNITGYDNLYAYRVSSSERILFSVDDDHIVIQDVVDTNTIKFKK